MILKNISISMFALFQIHSVFSQECTVIGNNAFCEEGENLPAGKMPHEYDSLTLNTSSAEKHGFSQYSDSGGVPDPLDPTKTVVLFKELNINTSGDRADGFRTFNFGPNVRIDSLKIKTKGLSADGINMGRDGTDAYLKVKGDVFIEADDGHGIRVVPSSDPKTESELYQRVLTLEKSSLIKVHGDGSFNSGYGVYAGLDEESCFFFLPCQI